MYRILLVKKV